MHHIIIIEFYKALFEKAYMSAIVFVMGSHIKVSPIMVRPFRRGWVKIGPLRKNDLNEN